MKLGGPEDTGIIPPFQRSIMESPVYSRRSTPGSSPNLSPDSKGPSPGSDIGDLEDGGSSANDVGSCTIIYYLWQDAVGVFLVFFLTLSIFRCKR